MLKNMNLCLMIGGLIFLGLILYLCINKKNLLGSKESYSNIGAIDNIGSLDTSYELIESPEEQVPASHFADLVDAGDHAELIKQPAGTLESVRPMERLDRIHTRDLLPRTAANVTPYHVDVANASTWAFSVNAPRVQLKNRQNMQADPYRGDIAITYHPDVALIGKSHWGRDALRLDGFFSDHFAALYNKYTNRAYKNMPLKVATQSTIMDYMPE